MNPVELLLCILGFFALVLPVCAVDAQELAREGLPGVRAIAITVGPRQLLQLAPVDWPKVDEVREVFARSFPGSMGRPYPPEGNARLRPGDPLYDTALDGAPALSREAATIQELVLVGGGRMDLDELLIVLEDSFGIHLSPEAAEAAARTVPDLEVLTSDDGSAQVFVIPQATMSEMEIRALEKRVYAGLVDLRRESAPETWDSFVASLPLALKGEPRAPVVIDLPVPPTDEVDRAGARALLRELHAWEKRATRTAAQLHALHEFGAMVERDAFPLRVVSRGVVQTDGGPVDLSSVHVSRGVEPAREGYRIALDDLLGPSQEDRTAREAKIHALALSVANTTRCTYSEARAHTEAMLVPPIERLHPGGVITGAFTVGGRPAPKPRVFVVDKGGDRLAQALVREGERAPCAAGHPDAEDCPRCRGVQIGGVIHGGPATDRLNVPWSPGLGREIAACLADAMSGWPQKGLLHVAEGRLSAPVKSAAALARFCACHLGYVPIQVRQLLTAKNDPFSLEAADQRFFVCMSRPGGTGSQCGEVYSPKCTFNRDEVTCPHCADTWPTS